MIKKKLQQIICAGTLMSTAVNLTPVFAYQSEEGQYSQKGTTNTQGSVQLLSDSVDDEDYEEEGSGQVIVKHIDADTGKELTREVYDDMPYGEVKVTSVLNLSGYTLQDSKEKIVYVTANNPVVTVTFKYKSTTSSTTKPDAGNTGNNNNSSNNNNNSNNNSSNNNSSNNNSSSNSSNTQKPSNNTTSNTTSNTTKPATNTNNTNTTQKPSTSTNNNSTNKPTTDVIEKDNDESKVEFGSVTINYIDINSGEIFKTSKKDKLSLTDVHTYSAIDVNGYTLHDESVKTVELSEANPHKTISFKYLKNNAVSTFGRARLQEAYDNKEEVTAYFESGNISINDTLIKIILDSGKENLILDLSEEVSNMDIIEELSESHDLNLLSTFSLSSNIDSEDLSENIVISKNLDNEYNDKTVHVYKLDSDGSADFVAEQIVKDGVISFETTLPLKESDEELSSTDYFISDTKLNEEVETIVENETQEVVQEVTQEVSDENTSSSVLIYVVVSAIASIGVIFGGIKLFKAKKKNK